MQAAKKIHDITFHWSPITKNIVILFYLKKKEEKNSNANIIISEHVVRKA